MCRFNVLLSILSALTLSMSLRMTRAAEADVAAFDALCQSIQQSAAVASEADVTKALTQAKELGRPYTAHLAVKPYFEQNLKPSGAVLVLAAENAYLAGDYRTAVGRFKAYLKDAPSNAENSAAAARMLMIQQDLLAANEDSYQFMRQQGTKFREGTWVRKFDQWFLDEARQRKDYAAAADRLAIVFAEKLPVEEERLYFWGHLDWLMDEFSRVQPEHFPASNSFKALVGLIHDCPSYAARAKFIAANLAYYANGFPANKERGAAEYETVVAAATAYFDGTPAIGTVQDIFQVFLGGYGRFDDGQWSVQVAAKQKFSLYALAKLNDADKKALLNLNLYGRPMARYIANGEQWLTLLPQFKVGFKPQYIAQLPLVENGNNPDLFKKQSEFLQGVPSHAAAVSNALVQPDLISAFRYVFQKETWYMNGGEAYAYMRNDIWPSYKGFPRPADKQVQDKAYYDAMLEAGPEMFFKSPLAYFDRGAARETLQVYWQFGGQGNDKTKFAAILHALDWVPYSVPERKEVFGQTYDQFKQWADALRKQSQTDKNPKLLEDMKQITALDAAFQLVMNNHAIDAAKAPDPLCQKLALAVQALHANDKAGYGKNARELYAVVRDYEAKKTPFGSMIFNFVCLSNPNVDAFDLQLEILADQLTLLDPAGSERQIMEICTQIPEGQKDWRRHAWNWWETPKGNAKGKQVDNVVAKGILAMAEKDQFSPNMFSLFRSLRRGNGWQEQALNSDVVAKMIEKKLLSKTPYYPEGWVRSNAASYQWLISREFQSLAKQYPHETYFDEMTAQEIVATKYIDRSYWQFGRDEKRIVANAVATLLATYDKIPYGYDTGVRTLELNDFWEWHSRALGADPAIRDQWLTKIESTYGKTRYDSYAMGAPYFSTKGNIDKPEAKTEYFARYAAYLERARTQPSRVGPPFSDALTKVVDIKTLAKDQLDILLKTFPENVPARWTPSNQHEALVSVVYSALLAQGRDRELFALVPFSWKMAKDINSPTLQRSLAQFAKTLSDQSKDELAAVFISAGLDYFGGEMAEDVQTMLRTLRAKSMVNVGSVNPFKRTDPRYPIGNAQAEFLSGKLQSAWEIYLPHRQLAVANYKDLDASFCLWLIQKDTEARQFDDAEALARLMLQYFEATTGGFDAETRARLLVNYGNIAFERQEYPRARAHFERIAEAKEYDGTRAKRDAELKIAEVDRRTRNYDRAIAQLEKLLKRRDEYLQVEAPYLLAQIKFDQEDYAESAKYLAQVFNKDRNHEGARILEGKLALQMKHYEKALDLAFGHASAQEMLIPGRPLKVTLEDKNLSVVGRAIQIEIRAWTDHGDEEFFSLLPFGDSKTVFEGKLPTAMGKIVKGDHVLQVFGGEKVHYEFSENFKKNHKISEDHPGILLVASDGELFVSSGKILSLEEQQERALEVMVRERLRQDPNVKDLNKESLSKLRDDNQIKPGNPINVRVIDPDRNTTAEKDTIFVKVSATSGDKIPAFPLVETDPTSGVFEGSIPTASAQAIAYAPDSEEGRDPNFVISTGANIPHWVAMPDSVKPKFFSVDMNDSVTLGKMTLDANVPGRKLKAFLLQTSLNGKEYKTVGQWPDELKAWDGSMTMEMVRYYKPDNGPGNLAGYREYLESGYIKGKASKIFAPVPTLAMKFADPELNGKAKDLGLEYDGTGSNYILHIYGAFSLPARQTRVFNLERKGGDINRYRGILTIDGQPDEKSPETIKRSLTKGVHRIDLYIFGWRHSRADFKVLCDSEEPPFMIPCPPEMFDVAKSPEIKAAMAFEPVKIQADKDGGSFGIAFGPEATSRTLRLVIADYETDAPAIQKITLLDKDGKQLLPTKEDFAALRKNQILEIIPGDRISVVYQDPLTVSKGKELQEAFLTATFHNAKLSACFVEFKPGTNHEPEYIPMRRFKVGDKINVFINDPDLDISDKEDIAEFTARTSSGKSVKFKALETEKHSGIFIGTIFPVAGAPQRDVELTVAPGDDVIVTYRDMENTNPGIPWDIDYTVEQIGGKPPELRIFNVVSTPLTPAEQENLQKLKKPDSLGVEEQVPVTHSLVASWPEKVTAADGVTKVPATGPLIVELKYPALAQSARSTASIYVQTASARKKAGKDGKENEGKYDIAVPGTLKLERIPQQLPKLLAPSGYTEPLVRVGRNTTDPLDDGRFLYYIPMKLGILPEKTLVEEETPKDDRDREKEQTPLTVWGSDTVYVGFTYKDQAGADQWITQKVALTSDVMFNAMERRYQEERTGIYVGETLYFRAINFDGDVSDEKDTTEITLSSAPGKEVKVKLVETLAHSGVFKGLVRLNYAGDKLDKPDPEVFPVNYGDTITVSCPTSNGKNPIQRTIQVFKGADGKVIALTKRFKDPAIAVQTQLTLAEAYFEQAKRHRELGQKPLAAKEILQGKNILEEAQRDYPSAEARAQVDYLLANLSLEYAGDAEDEESVKKHHLEAIARFTDFVINYPDSQYAPKAQYKKALTLEKMNQMDQACEEYVKLSYRYPDNELVAETIARLGQYFWNKGKTMTKDSEGIQDPVEAEKVKFKARDMYKTAGQVFGRLSQRFPQHGLAGKTKILSAQCFIQSGDLQKALEIFNVAIKDINLDKDLVAEAMYWSGDTSMKLHDYPSAYRQFVKLTWDYPASKWAKFARGRLTEDELAKVAEQQTQGEQQ